jgi:glycerophosphoryl diester phosphodiesterase
MRLPVIVALLASPIVSPASGRTVEPSLLCATANAARIAAHRSRRDASRPENSLAEMRATARVAPYMLELDLALDADGDMLLLHDDSVDRTTDGHGVLAAMNRATVARLRLRGDHGAVSREPLPGFAAVAKWAEKADGVTLMLDIKHVAPVLVAPVVRARHLTRRVVVLTFDRATATAALAADPDWLVSVLVKDEADLAAYHALAGDRRIAAYVPTFAPPAMFAAARRAGAVVISDAMSAGPSGSPDDIAGRNGIDAYRRHLAERPADILVTDHANRLPACLAPQREAVHP